MSTAVAAPLQSQSTLDIPYHNMTSPTQQAKQRSNNNNKPPRARNNNKDHYQNTQSDSGLPNHAQTPRAKKVRPRHNDHRAASGSDIPKSKQSKPVTLNSKSPMATPAKPAAYAGPTFHASPAACNLPMPKFASKSVPPPATANSLQAKLDAESTKANAPSPATEAAAPTPLTREYSPLDIFFKADRQERAQKTSSPAMQRRITPPEGKAMFPIDLDSSNSPSAARSPAPVSPAKAEADRQAATQSLKNFLNLQPSNPSPAQSPAQNNPFVTPQQQRTLEADPSLHYGNRNLSPLFHAARNPSSPYATPQRDPSAQSRQNFDPRAYLESHVSQQQSPFISRPQDAFPAPASQPQQQVYHNPGQFAGGPSRPQPPPLHHSHSDYSPNVKDMEAKLRGMLKLC